MDALEHNEDASSSWSSDYSSEDEHSYPMMRELVWLLAFDSQEWRPPWPPSSNCRWYMVPWCVRVYATQARSCSLLRIHGYSLLHRFDQDQDNMCCTEYAHTIGTNCWRALAQIELTEFQPARLWVPATVPHRCTGAFRHTSPMGHWELTHSQWCDATCPCARNLPLCLPDTTDLARGRAARGAQTIQESPQARSSCSTCHRRTIPSAGAGRHANDAGQDPRGAGRRLRDNHAGRLHGQDAPDVGHAV